MIPAYEIRLRIRLLCAWVKIHRRPLVIPSERNEGWNEGSIEICRAEIKFLIRLLREEQARLPVPCATHAEEYIETEGRR